MLYTDSVIGPMIRMGRMFLLVAIDSIDFFDSLDQEPRSLRINLIAADLLLLVQYVHRYEVDANVKLS